jgi:hypothetical protein
MQLLLTNHPRELIVNIGKLLWGKGNSGWFGIGLVFLCFNLAHAMSCIGTYFFI